MAEEFLVKAIKKLIADYRQKMLDCDRTERLQYSIMIDDLKEILSEYAHR
jgi:hypothetical protein